MAESSVKTEICEACGAEVRQGSLFCYNCGGAVAKEAEEILSKNNGVSNTWFQSDIAKNKEFKTTKLKQEKAEIVETEPIKETKEEIFPVNDETKKPLEKSSFSEKGKMKSAANMRRKAKIYQNKKVEVVWEEPEGAPNVLFPVVALILILLVGAIYLLAMYLK